MLFTNWSSEYNQFINNIPIKDKHLPVSQIKKDTDIATYEFSIYKTEPYFSVIIKPKFKRYVVICFENKQIKNEFDDLIITDQEYILNLAESLDMNYLQEYILTKI